MINDLKNEYIDAFGNNKLILIKAFVAYWRVPQFRVVVLTRAMQNAHFTWYRKHLKNILKLKYAVDIGLNSKIGNNFRVEHYIGMVIGDKVTIGNNCTIYQNVTLGQRKGFYPTVENDVTIYPGAIILGDINLGERSIILAGSVVLNDVEADSMVGGNPAVVYRITKTGDNS